MHINCLELKETTGGSDIPQGSPRHFSVAGTGQPNGSGLHQQSGRNRVPHTDSSSKISMALGLDQEYSPDSPAHSRSNHLHSRRGISPTAGPVRLPKSIWNYQSSMENSCRPHGDQSFQSHMTLTLGSGQAGVINGAMIPLRVLCQR